MSRLSFIGFAALALGVLLALGACGKEGTDPVEPVDLLDLLKSQSEVRRGLTIDSKAMKRQMKYNVYLPPKFDAQKAYPVLYLLHGAGDDENAWLDKGYAKEIADDYINRQKGVPMIIVMPDAQLTFYVKEFETYLHEELMPAVESSWKFSGKRAVAGLSMGGYGTLYHALKYPEKFTCAYAMSPATSEEFKTFVDARPDKKVFPPFTIEVGEQDYTVDNAASRSLADYMSGQGLNVEFISRAGVHYWNFWQECLPKALKKTGESF